ncbi:MAG: hypothetical protein IPL74_01505 [Bacteroidetes bacterium]|nr:hypothetical protein [Bacteroidota bacterium]
MEELCFNSRYCRQFIVLCLYQGNNSSSSGLIYNKQHQLMVNGDDILGQGWYNEMVVLPSPNNSDQYYLFSIGVTFSSDYGLFYSVIDMSLDGGLGAVTQKNIMLDSVPAVDCLKAIKHGNGRD